MENKYDLIEKYLNNEMTVKEAANFEEVLRSDQDLMAEFLFRRKINQAIMEEDVMDLRDSLKEIMNHRKKHIIGIENKFVYSSAAALILALLVMASIYLLPKNRTLDTDKIYHQYYSVYPAVVAQRSSEHITPENKMLINAFSAYQEGEYNMSSVYFKQVFQFDNSNKVVAFYKAISEIENNNFDEAEKLLQELVVNSNHIFWEQSHWYLALVKIYKKDLEQAVHLLQKIVKEDMCKKDDAGEILKSIDS